MAEKSMYARGGDGMTTGGLDGYLGPEAQDHSSLSIDGEGDKADNTPDVDCANGGNGEAVCEIADALKSKK